MTRLGDLLHIGQLFKACGNNYFAQIAHPFIQFYCKDTKNFHFSCEIMFGQLLQTFGDFLLVTLLSPQRIVFESEEKKINSKCKVPSYSFLVPVRAPFYESKL